MTELRQFERYGRTGRVESVDNRAHHDQTVCFDVRVQ